MLQKVRIWFQNNASALRTSEPDLKAKAHMGRGKKTTYKDKDVCGRLFRKRVIEKQTELAGGVENSIQHYQAALTAVFDSLTDTELQTCKDQCKEWNDGKVPEEIQQQ